MSEQQNLKMCFNENFIPLFTHLIKSKAALLSSQPSLAGEIWIKTLHDMDSTTQMEKNAIIKNCLEMCYLETRFLAKVSIPSSTFSSKSEIHGWFNALKAVTRL